MRTSSPIDVSRFVLQSARLFAVIFVLLVAVPPALAATQSGNLVDVSWLQKHLSEENLLILDASPAKAYAAGHLPGAVNVDLMGYGVQEASLAEAEQRLRSWGVTAGKRVVVYDGGGSFLAPRLFFTLAYYGFPTERLAVLDGGMAKWQSIGGPVSTEPVTPPKGTFRVTGTREELRVRLPEVVTASGDREHSALVEALDPDWHYGEVAPFGRPGHIPNSVLLPSADFFNADKTFKSPEELRRILAYVDVRPEQTVYSYCGGGIAASVPFFAMKYLLGYPKVELFVESEIGWMKDPRELPYWTYDAPYMLRDAAWLRSWNGAMMRMYGVSQVSVIDVRPKEAYEQGHVPFAINIPASLFAAHLSAPETLTTMLGASGVDPSHEAVIISGSGITGEAALAFAVLEKLGQKRVSILAESLDGLAQKGIALTKEATAVGEKKGPGTPSVLPASYSPAVRNGIVVADAASSTGIYPKVFVASGSTVPANAPAGTVVHVPFAQLVGDDGKPKAAKDIWKILSKAGVPRYAEVLVLSEDPAEAAANLFILRLMGWPDVKMLASN